MPRFQRTSLLVLTLAALLAGCGGGGGGGGGTPTPKNGIVRTAYTQIPLVGATVVFYDSAGTAIGTATVGSDGLILGSGVPGAVQFSIDPSTTTVSGPFYNTFLYNGSYYSSSSKCYAPLPSNGAVRLPKDAVVFVNGPDNPPPPPVDGCGIG